MAKRKRSGGLWRGTRAQRQEVKAEIALGLKVKCRPCHGKGRIRVIGAPRLYRLCWVCRGAGAVAP